MTARTRPPFIICIMADQQGCGYHRIQIPLASLVEEQVADGRIDMGMWPDHVVQAAAPDVIVFQRQIEDQNVEVMERWRKLLPDTVFIFELDDYLGDIPAASFHKGFMPPEIPEKTARALKVCDRVTTTTAVLAEWLTGLGGKNVHIVPNAIPAKRMHEREPRQSGRLRIGFAGGMSHSGDLKLIEPAIREIGDQVDWVFMGTRPDDPDLRVEFHEGTAPIMYLDALAKLDIDLMLAPLEDHHFNHCKSNLRLVEAGAVGACVIAQDLTPYLINTPPVFAYASTAEDWTREIRRFIDAKISERRMSADKLRAWVGRHYILERNLKARMQAWLPEGEPFRPLGARRQIAPLVLCCSEDNVLGRLSYLKRVKHVDTGLDEAVRVAIEQGSDLLWMRPATFMSEGTLSKLRATLDMATDMAAVVPFASDGYSAFPVATEWMPMSQGTVTEMEKITSRHLRGRKMKVNTIPGPIVLISNNSLRMLGAPDIRGCGSEEQALFEWGLRAKMRQWQHLQVADTFVSSLARPPQPPDWAALRLEARGTMSWLRESHEEFTPAERETIELELLRTQWGAPRPGSMGFDAGYASWKALHNALTPISEFSSGDGKRPIVSVRQFGEPFAPFGWIIHVDENVILAPGAIEEFSRAIFAAGDDVEVVYSDHETLFPELGASPEFKPDFDKELFLAQDYVTPLCAVHALSPFADRQALYGYVLDKALTVGRKAFVHIPKVLASVTLDMKPEEAALDALQRQLQIADATGDNVVVTAHRHITGCLSVVRDWPRGKGFPLVSIVVPTLGNGRLIQPCINTIRQHTKWPNYEIIVVQNGARAVPELGDAARDKRVKVVRWDGPFNWSAINNFAIREHAHGDFIVTLNDDVTIGFPAWLGRMMGQIHEPDVGIVGARLLHPAGYMQHCGVISHKGVAGHMHKGLPNGKLGSLGRAVLTHEATAVTGACMLFRRELFDELKGFAEDMPRNYNDTDFCLRAYKAGKRNIVEMSVELLHPEGASRDDQMSPENLKLLARENTIYAKRHPEPDPYWNPSMLLDLVHGGLMVQGLNADGLSWADAVPEENQKRILLINDLPGLKGRAIDVITDGGVPMAAELSGFSLRLTAPNARNTAPFDVRDPVRLKNCLNLLGVTAIVLRSWVGTGGAAAPVDTLHCFAELGINVMADFIPGQNDWLTYPWNARDDMPRDYPFRTVDKRSWKDASDYLWPPVANENVKSEVFD